MRPIVPVSLTNGSLTSTPSLALVDSGCDHVLAAPWVATDIGVDPDGGHRERKLGLGAATHHVRFHDLTLRLYAPDGNDDHFVEWQAEVGFVREWKPSWTMLVGQTGFMSEFTVTFGRIAQQVAIDSADKFDEQFGVRYTTIDIPPSRFAP